MRAGALPRGLVCLSIFFLALTSCSTTTDGPGPNGPVDADGVGPVGEESGIRGSGTITRELTEVDPFIGFVFDSEGTVELELASGPQVVIEADDNLHQYLDATVTDSILTVATQDGVDIAPSESILFRIQTPDLDSIVFSGVGSIAMPLWTSPGSVRIEITGAGDVAVDELVADAITVDLRGVGSLEVAGRVTTQEVVMTGTGDYAAADLRSSRCVVRAEGTGTATVWATDVLEATAQSPGSVTYYGEPALTSAGSGPVNGMGAK